MLFFSLITCLLHNVLIFLREIQYWSLMGFKGLKGDQMWHNCMVELYSLLG